MIQPTQDKSAATNFLKNFAKMCLERNDRVFLMLVFLYTKAHPEKNNNQDFFKEVKQTALQFTKKYKKKDKGIYLYLSIYLYIYIFIYLSVYL